MTFEENYNVTDIPFTCLLYQNFTENDRICMILLIHEKERELRKMFKWKKIKIKKKQGWQDP